MPFRPTHFHPVADRPFANPDGSLTVTLGSSTVSQRTQPQSNPYGLAVTPDGMVWYTEMGTQPDTIVHFDRQSSAFARAAIPFATGGVQNMTAASEGSVYLTSSGVDKVGAMEVSK